MPHYGPSGGPVVSVIVFYSDNPSLNPAKANIFSGKFVFEKNENKQKESGGWSILNTCHITLIHKSLLIDLKYQQSAIILFQHKFAFLKWASFFLFSVFSIKKYNFTAQTNVKNVLPVSGDRTQTQISLILSLLP